MNQNLKSFQRSLPFLFLMLGFFAVDLNAQAPAIIFNPIVTSGLTTPIDITNAGDGSNRLFIAQKDGKIRYLRNNQLVDTIFLDIANRISSDGERGLLSLAFHPQYATNGYLFVYYTNPVGNIVLERFHVSTDRNKADENSGLVLITIPHTEFSNHNGGKLNFGSDGFLYFATGDGGSGGDPHFNAQNKDTLLGKMLRIDVNNFATSAPFYSIPAGNPYAAANDNARDEIWATGLRNPFRWSFDRLTHDMWIGDVGQGAREEVDFLPVASAGGTNFGWRCYEGNLSYRDSGCLAAGNYQAPVFDYDRTAVGGTSITGGMVYRGAAYPGLYGWYTCIDFNSGNAWMIQPNGAAYTIRPQGVLATNITGFGEDEAGELYTVALTGTIYRVQPAVVLAVKLESFTLSLQSNNNKIHWQTVSEQNQRAFDVEAGTDGVHFTTIGIVPATNRNSRQQYTFQLPNSNPYTYFRLKMTDNSGAATYSDIIRTAISTGSAVVIAPTLVQNHLVNIQLRQPFKNLRLFDMNGRTMMLRDLGQRVGSFSLDVSALSKGVYTIRFDNANGTGVYRKIMVQ